MKVADLTVTLDIDQEKIERTDRAIEQALDKMILFNHARIVAGLTYPWKVYVREIKQPRLPLGYLARCGDEAHTDA